MDNLNPSERELVALGAAMGSNCIPCIEYHIPKSRDAGLSDKQIAAAIRLADKVRKVPAAKVLAAATAVIGAQSAAEGADDDCGCEPEEPPSCEPTEEDDSCC